MQVRAQCSNPECGKSYTLSADLIGKNVRCKQCRQTFTVSSSQETFGGESSVRSDTAEVVTKDTSSQRLARFEIHERLGGGAYGVVYRAFDPQLDREVALKVPRAGTLERAGAVQRFMREAKAAAQLRHPNIVPIYDAGRDGDQYYIASAFIAGRPLEDAVEEGPLQPRRAARIVRELAEAFDYAHNQGIIHRDIKPANVMLDQKDHPHVMDFGLARVDSITAKLTQDGTIMGTPSYMSPEQAAGQNAKVTAASDQYSLGVVLYELLTGQTPFSGPPHVVIVNILKTPTPPPRGINPKVPRDLETICLKAMAKEPERRYASCGDFAEDLRRWMQGEPIGARRTGPAERLVRWCKRNPVVAGLTLTAGVLLAMIAGISSFAAVRLKVLADSERLQLQRANEQAENSQRQQRLAEQERAKAEQLAAANANLAQKEAAAATRARQTLYAAHMNLAHNAWEDRRLLTIQRLLQQWNPITVEDLGKPASLPADFKVSTDLKDLRDFEWHYLDRTLNSDLLTLPGDYVVAFNVDQTRYASGGSNRTVTVRDLTSGNVLRTVSDLDSRATSIDFSPDGNLLAIGTEKSMVTVRKLSDGQQLFSDSLDSGAIGVIRFNGDGSKLAFSNRFYTQGRPSEGKIVGTSLPRSKVMLIGHKLDIRSLEFSPDGKRVVTTGADSTTRLWNVDSGAEVWSLNTSYGDAAFSPDGKRIAITNFPSITLNDADTGNQILAFERKSGSITDLAFSSDGNTLASSNTDSTVTLWDLSTSKEIKTLKAHFLGVNNVLFSQDGNRLLTSGSDGQVKLWDVTRPQDCHAYLSNSMPYSTTFVADGAWFITAGYGILNQWDFNTLRLKKRIKVHDYLSFGTAISKDGSLIATAGAASPDVGEAKVWNSQDGQLIAKMAPISGTVWGVAFNSEGDRLVTAADNDVPIQLWDSKNGQLLRTLSQGRDNCRCVTFSHNGQYIAAGFGSSIKVFEFTSGREVVSLKGNSGFVNSVTFSTDDTWLASGGWDGTARIWSIRDGTEIAVFKGHSENINTVAFSPNGRRLATCSGRHEGPGELKIWDIDSQAEVLQLKGHKQGVSSVAFSPDGKQLVSTSWDSEIRIWDARPSTLEMKSERHALTLINAMLKKQLSTEQAIQSLDSDRSIPEPVRVTAKKLIPEFAEDFAKK